MDSKKENTTKKSIVDFVEKKSFYVMVVLCVCIVIFSGLFITSKNIISSIRYESNNAAQYEDITKGMGSGEENQAPSIKSNEFRDSNKMKNVSSKIVEETSSSALKIIQAGQIQANQQEAMENMIPKSTVNSNQQLSDVSKKASVSSIATENKKKAVTSKKIVLQLPVFGRVSYGYSASVPVYSKTLNEWRTHEGIDIAASPGSQVKAAESGVVKEVKNDPRYGFTIVIDHGDDLRTIYAALVQSTMVAPNQKVSAGDVIGILGNTASFEILEPAHLHFEVVKNEKNVNPQDYLPGLVK